MEEASEETLYISINLCDKKFKIGGSLLGRKFLHANSDICESFFDFCKAFYSDEDHSTSSNKKKRQLEQESYEEVSQMFVIGLDSEGHLEKGKLNRKVGNSKKEVSSDKIHEGREIKHSVTKRRSARIKDSADILKKAQARKESLDTFTSTVKNDVKYEPQGEKKIKYCSKKQRTRFVEEGGRKDNIDVECLEMSKKPNKEENNMQTCNDFPSSDIKSTTNSKGRKPSLHNKPNCCNKRNDSDKAENKESNYKSVKGDVECRLNEGYRGENLLEGDLEVKSSKIVGNNESVQVNEVTKDIEKNDQYKQNEVIFGTDDQDSVSSTVAIVMDEAEVPDNVSSAVAMVMGEADIQDGVSFTVFMKKDEADNQDSDSPSDDMVMDEADIQDGIVEGQGQGDISEAEEENGNTELCSGDDTKLSKNNKKKDVPDSFINCKVCSERLSENTYAFHLRRVHRVLNAFSCDKCKNSFNSSKALNKHKLTHQMTTDCLENQETNSPIKKEILEENESNLTCNICLKVLSSKASLENHIAKIHDNDLRCKVCLKQFTTAQHLATHKLIHQRKSYRCETCDKEFHNANSLVCHARKDHGEKRPGCYICSSFFETELEKNKHLQTHRAARVNNFSCPKCGKTFENLEYLKTHNKNVHHSNELICKVCCEYFKTKLELRKHMWKHRLDPMYLCRICKASFKTMNDMVHHTKEIHQSYYYICDVCGDEFDSKLTLKRHQKNSHGPNITYDCHMCGSSFSSDECLKKHIECVHCQTRDFQCDECGVFFKTKGVLKAHVKRHRQENNNKCLLCEAVFKSIDGLNNHILDHHAEQVNLDKIGFKVYECEYCGKRSSQKAIHIRHVRTHTGEKPHECKWCGAKFPIPAALNRHVKRNHLGMKKHQCKICDIRFADHSHLQRHYQTNLHKLRESSGNSIETVQSINQSEVSKTQLVAIPSTQDTIELPNTNGEEVQEVIAKSESKASIDEMVLQGKENIQVIYVDHIAQSHDFVKQDGAEQVYAVENTSLINFQDSTIYVISEAEDTEAFVQSLSFTE